MIKSMLDVKILQLLSKFESGVNISRIADNCKTTNQYADRSLQRLKQEGLVVEHDYGRIRVFKLDLSNPKTKHVKALFGGEEK